MTVLSDRVDVLETTNATLVTILNGLRGTLQSAVDAGQGPQGWSPELTVQSDGARRVLQITDWTGGVTGATKPDVDDYIGASGLEALIADAIDIRGAAGTDGDDGADGDGWTGATYNAGTGVLTFASADGLGFVTGDLRGPQGDAGADGTDGTDGTDGDGFTGGSYNSGTGVITFASADGLGFATGDVRGADGSDGADGTDGADSTVQGPQGDGFTGGTYTAETGVVTFTSGDGLGFSTGDLRGADGDGAGTVTSVATGAGLTGGPITASGTVALDAASIASLELADSATQPGDLGDAAAADIGTGGVQAYDDVLENTTASYTSEEETKLSNIEAAADVTDATNVAAAGALMDSEVVNLAAVKAFDVADYATADQGTLADNAAPLASPALTGNPTAPTQAEGNDSTRLATTAFVLANAGGGGDATKTTYLTSTTWTKPAGARIVIVEAWGGGAGGKLGTQPGGGGGGGYAEIIIPADDLGSSVAITIGAGGVAGGASGGNGGDTTFGAFVTGPGGVASAGSSGGDSGGGQKGGDSDSGFKAGNGGYSGGGGGAIGGSGGNAIKGGGGGAGGGNNNPAGGTSVYGGNGGAGAGSEGTAGSGAVPGGGGGSAGSGETATSGAGGAGQITITVIT
jgi:hypothetical protein